MLQSLWKKQNIKPGKSHMPVVFSDNVTPGTHSEPPLFIKGDEIFRNGCNRGEGGGESGKTLLEIGREKPRRMRGGYNGRGV